MNPTLIAYLQSKQAIADVAASLNRYHRNASLDVDDDPWLITKGVILDNNNPWTNVRCLPDDAGGFYPTNKSISAYFKPTGEDRYLVTNLGETAHAIRLHTGLIHLPFDLISKMARKYTNDNLYCDAGCLPDQIIMSDGIGTTIHKSNLAAAICRCLLISYQISHTLCVLYRKQA